MPCLLTPLRLAQATVFTLVALDAALLLAAEPPRPRSLFPFAEPQDFFDQLFGKETPADKGALAKIEITPQEERDYGNRAAQTYLAELRRHNIDVVSRGKDVEYLQRLVATMRPFMHHGKRYRSITIYVAQSEHTDARCFPGGTLIFFRGLLDFAESEAALVGVIGHELSHLDRGHQLKTLRRWKLAQQTFSGAGRELDFRQLMSKGRMLMRMFARPFEPDEETEADRDGATWAFDAGYDPRQMAALFLRLHDRDKNKPQFMPAFFRTHPFHIDRFHAIRQLDKQLRRKDPRKKLYIGKSNLRLRVPREQREFED